MKTQAAALRVIGPNASDGVAQFLVHRYPRHRPLLVCDDATWVAAAEKIYLQLAEYRAGRHSFGTHVRAQYALAESLLEVARGYDLLIAIGSGTINDLTKYAAILLHKPYLSVPTAASMNGYTSATASLEKDGHKQSYHARPPVAVIADTTILAAAPQRMTCAGLGDTLCRPTVEADMLLSHHLLGTPYPRALFERLRSHEADLIALASTTGKGDTRFVERLMTALLDAGDAMTTFGSSAPASQGEHMIVHTLEMLFESDVSPFLHGELVALATLAVHRLQQKMMQRQPMVKRLTPEAKQFDLVFGKKAGSLYAHYQHKLLSAEQVEAMNHQLASEWRTITTQIAQIAPSPHSVEQAFAQCGLAITPETLGLSDERFRFAGNHAFMVRDRFTFLDLAAMNDERF